LKSTVLERFAFLEKSSSRSRKAEFLAQVAGVVTEVAIATVPVRYQLMG
jgi:hypothetical protein